MPERYAITPKQVAALRALGEGIVELSIPEIAVSARLLPNEAREALGTLESLGLTNSWIPITGRTGEKLFVLTSEGQNAYRALSEFKGLPPVGAVVRLRKPFPTFSGWLSGQQFSSNVEIVPDVSV